MPIIIELPGTMYNIIHGVNRYALFWLGMLGLPPSTLGRFRDCYLQRGSNGELEICVYTRNGGVHRNAAATATEMLRTHPMYIRDYDDEYDPTYAAYVFKPSVAILPTLKYLVKRDPDNAIPGSHHDRAQAFITRLKCEPTNSEAQRIRNVMRAVVPKIVPSRWTTTRAQTEVISTQDSTDDRASPELPQTAAHRRR